jgi:hypothetical protein
MEHKTTKLKHLIFQMKEFCSSNDTKIVLLLVLSIFVTYSVFIAINLQENIIPDEPAHFTFSKHYSSTWGIPPDVPETYTLGWYIYRNPFLYYWINGRIINVLELIKPNISDWQMLVALRLVNVIYALGTVIFCFFLSKELIKHKWLSLLPVFMLTNTLMFVFLAGGVNYDNLANLFSMAGLFFFVRVLNHKKFIGNSYGWIISIFTGTLVKFTILPLALILIILWTIFTIKNKAKIFPLVFSIKRDILLTLVLVFIFLGNSAIYGYNLLTYQSITPDCTDILSIEQCKISPYSRRYEDLALEKKLTIDESIDLGYPDPLTYLIDSWFPNMLYRIFGILGHQSYFPTRIIIYYRLLIYSAIIFAVRYWKKPHFTYVSLIIIIIFYGTTLFFSNYDSELVYGFRQIAMQGRYFFPVIGITYVLFTLIINRIPTKFIRNLMLSFTLFLFIIGGPIKFLRFSDTIFSGWFIK